MELLICDKKFMNIRLRSLRARLHTIGLPSESRGQKENFVVHFSYCYDCGWRPLILYLYRTIMDVYGKMDFFEFLEMYRDCGLLYVRRNLIDTLFLLFYDLI